MSPAVARTRAIEAAADEEGIVVDIAIAEVETKLQEQRQSSGVSPLVLESSCCFPSYSLPSKVLGAVVTVFFGDHHTAGVRPS